MYKYVDNIGDIICSKLNIVDVINGDTLLTKKGRNYKACCPFHNEKTPSFVVSEEKQIFKCFGCGESGNLITFIQKYHRLGFVDAIEYLSDRYSLDLNEYRNKNSNFKKLDDYYDLNREVAKYYFDNFNKNKKAQEYMKNRGIKIDVLRKFGIGFSVDNWSELYNKYKSEIKEELIEKSGLFINGKNDKYYDRFRNRIMFPIFDVRKRVIGFGARAFGDEKPKYLNSPDTPVYNKSFHLYGLNYSKNTSNNFFILVEGYMDVIALFNADIECAIASLGTSLTSEQARLIKKYNKNVYIVYDGDDAGIKATHRAIDVLKKEKINTYAITLPELKDPDEYIKENGKEKFLEYIELNKLEGYAYILSSIKSKYDIIDNPSDKYSYLKEASDFIKKIEDSVDRAFYMKILADELSISDVELLKEIDEIGNNEKLLSNTKQKNKKIDNINLKKFMSIVVNELNIAKKVISSNYFKFLSDDTRKLITFIVGNDGYDFDKVVDLMSIEYVDFIEKVRKIGYSDIDINNWEVLYKYIVDIKISKNIELIRKQMIEDKDNKIKYLKSIEYYQNIRASIKKGDNI